MPQPFALAQPLLAWFDTHKRVLPFRSNKTPYSVWVSEIMLQQTRVSAVLPYYERFMAALPEVADLAVCDEEKLHKLWEGLGYYSRVRNLQKAAREIMQQYGGQLPADVEKLRALPGIGDYTAGAVASLAFGLSAAAVDGNVLRVFSRLHNDARDIALPQMKKDVTAAVLAAQPPQRAGDFNEALMELGALVCTPQSPVCAQCPLQAQCAAYAAGTQNELPVKAAQKPRRMEEYTVVLALAQDRVLLCRRPQSGLLAGLWQPLLLPGALQKPQLAAALSPYGFTLRAPVKSVGDAKHIFSHIEWNMHLVVCPVEFALAPENCVWASGEELENVYTLPTAFKAARKVLNAYLCTDAQ